MHALFLIMEVLQCYMHVCVCLPRVIIIPIWCILLYRKENSLFDEMTNFVNQAFGNGKSDVSN